MSSPQTRTLVLSLPWHTVVGGMRLAGKRAMTIDQLVASLLDGAIAVDAAAIQALLDAQQ